MLAILLVLVSYNLASHKKLLGHNSLALLFSAALAVAPLEIAVLARQHFFQSHYESQNTNKTPC